MDRSKGALSWTELRVGLVAIVSLLILAATVLYIGGGGSPFAGKYTLKALMADVNGLKTGAPVRLGGVEVGSVTRVEFSREGQSLVEITMRVEQRVQDRITSESRAELGALGLLGEKAVDIAASSRGTPIQDGGYLPAASEDAFKGLLADTSESVSYLKKILARMDAGQGLIGKALRDEELYDRMLDVSTRLQAVMERLESPRGPLGRLMNDERLSQQLADSVAGIHAVVSRVERGEGALGALSRDEKLVRDLKEAASSLNQVAGRVQRGEGSLGRMVADDTLVDRFESAVTRLDAVLVKLEAGEGSASRLLRDPELYENLNSASRELKSLLADVRKDPQRYLRVKLSLF